MEEYKTWDSDQIKILRQFFEYVGLRHVKFLIIIILLELCILFNMEKCTLKVCIFLFTTVTFVYILRTSVVCFHFEGDGPVPDVPLNKGEVRWVRPGFAYGPEYNSNDEGTLQFYLLTNSALCLQFTYLPILF